MFGRIKPAVTSMGLNALPSTPFCPPTQGQGGWRPFAPQATDNVQVGAYQHPPLTQVGAYWPDRQLNCGVNGISRSWTVGTAAGNARPYNMQTVFPQNPAHLLQSGARSGGQQPLTILSDSFNPRAYSQGVTQGAVASGAMGW